MFKQFPFSENAWSFFRAASIVMEDAIALELFEVLGLRISKDYIE